MSLTLDPMLSATIYELSGLTTDMHTKRVKDKVYDVPEVGGCAFEMQDGRTFMFLKHKSDVELDDDAITAAVRSAGSFDVIGRGGAGA